MNLVPSIARLVITRLGWLFASGDDRDAEILALRHQILVRQRQVPHPTFTETDRTILAALSTVFDRARLSQRLCCVVGGRAACVRRSGGPVIRSLG
jgi:hypothetical protein